MNPYTDRSERVFQLAKEAAEEFKHKEVHVAHILIGLLRDGSGVAANILKNRRFSVSIVKTALSSRVLIGASDSRVEDLPWDQFAQYVTQRSLEEARALSHSYVGTEHLLLAMTNLSEHQWLDLASEQELKEIRQEVFELLGHGEEKPNHKKILARVFAIRDAVEQLAKDLQQT